MSDDVASPKNASKPASPPTSKADSDGVKAAKALLEKYNTGEEQDEELPAAVSSAVKGGIASAAGLSKQKSTKKAEPKAEPDAEPLPTSVEKWLVKMKQEHDDEDLPAAVAAAMRGGIATAAGQKREKSKNKTFPTADPTPPGVKEWLEKNKDVPKWEEKVGDTVAAAMYGGGINAAAGVRRGGGSKKKKKEVVNPEEEIPRAIKLWLEQNKGKTFEEEEEEDVSEAFSSALKGGIAEAAGLRELKEAAVTSKKLEVQAEKSDNIAPGVKAWLEQQNKDAESEEKSEAFASAVSGGIATAAGLERRPSGPKQKEAEDHVPKSVTKWLEQQN